MPGQPRRRAFKTFVEARGGALPLIDRIASGESILRISKDLTQQMGTTVSHWMVSQYLHKTGNWDAVLEARKHAAAVHADATADMAEKVQDGTLGYQEARVAIAAKQWLASKMDPGVYGDRVHVDQTVTDLTQLHLQSLRERMKVVNTQVVLPRQTSVVDSAPE